MHETPTLTPRETRERAHNSAVSVWWSCTAFVSIAGPDAIPFLDAVATQAIDRIEPGTAAFALLLTNHARIVVPMLVYRTAEDELLLELAPQLVDTAISYLRRYKLRSKVTLEQTDLTSAALVGPESAQHLDTPGWYASPAWGLPAATLVAAADDVRACVDAAPDADAPHADPYELDALRIAAGVPSLTDFALDRMPAEVGAMDLAVALDKGCYIGQEPVARLHYRGHANRSLRQVMLSEPPPTAYRRDALDVADDYLMLRRASDAPDAKPVGQLTSWTRSDGFDGWIGFAVLRATVEDGEPLLLAGCDVAVEARQLAAHPANG